MFWNDNCISSSHLETLLSKENITLQELMDEEEVLQECRSQNLRLIEYLGRSEVLEELVTLTTVEPSGDDYSKYKYPNIACELLTCEVPQIGERLANDGALLGKLYSFLESKAPLNPLLASFFSKIFSVLIGRACQQNWYSYQLTCLQVLEFLKSKENFVTLLLKHLGTSAIMDLLYKLITKVEAAEMKQNILNWLDDQKLVQNLVALFDPTVDSDVHYNAAELLRDVISTAREARKESSEQDRILDRIESPETVSLLLDQIFEEPKCETSIIGGISVLMALLDVDKRNTEDIISNHYSTPVNVTEDNNSDPAESSEVVLSTLKAILPRLKDFHEILLNPPVKPAVNTTIGLLDPPLGNTRVQVAKLLTVVIAHNNAEINEELIKLDTLNVLLDLFFKYTWNNFLHAQVEHCLTFILNSAVSQTEGSGPQNNALIAQLFVQCRLLQRILDAWEDNETQQNVHKRPRRGYMGHLINIAILIIYAERDSLGALLPELVDSETMSKWEYFAATKLAEIQETYVTCLGGVHPQDDSDDGKLQAVYSGYYQLQALASSCPEQFRSYQEEQLNENEEMLNSSSDLLLQKISLDAVREGVLEHLSATLEEACNRRYPTLDDFDNDIDLVHEKKKTFGGKSDSPEGFENSSSDEDEPPERSGPEGREDTQNQFDTFSPWSIEGEKIMPPVEAVNPWDSATNQGSSANSSSPDFGWASFESAPFVADFALNFTPDIKTTIATSVPSSEIETIPLDLTPSDSNLNVDEIFSKSDSKMESAQVIENVPMTAVYTDFESITNTMNAMALNTENKERLPCPEGDAPATESLKGSGTDSRVSVEDSSKINSLQKLDLVGDVNSIQNDKEEIIDNFRFHSSQGLMTKCGQNRDESESGGDGFKLLQENVQSVPNESNQSSNKTVEIVESCNSPVTTTNGPV